jgi:hypothetical protein
MKFELGKYYWYDAPNNGGYYKCVKVSSNEIVGKVKCLWRTRDISQGRPACLSTKIGDVKTYSITASWNEMPGAGSLKTDFYIPTSQPLTVMSGGVVSPPSAVYKQWMLFNYKDVVFNIVTGETFIDKHWGEIEIVGFSRDRNNCGCRSTNCHKFPRCDDMMIEVVRPPADENDPQPILYLYWDEFFDRCTEIGDVGSVCVSCRRDYPYAIPSANFKCWGCKNGA